MQFTNGSFSFWDDSGTPVEEAIRISSANVSADTEVSTDDSGKLYDQAHALTRFAPTFQITMKSVDKVLSYIGLGGQCVGATEAVTKCDLITRALKTCDDPFSDGSHMRHRVGKGLLVLGTLTADRNADATISFTLHAFTDSQGNAPVAENNLVTLSNTVGTRFRLGLCSLAGYNMPELESVSIEFGVQLTDKDPKLGNIWPESAGVRQVQPKITFRTRDISQLRAAVFPLGAKTALHANTKIQLIKLADSGSFVPAATSGHLTITAAGMLVPDVIVDASAGGRATAGLMLHTIDDGVNAPLVSAVTTYNANPAGT